MRYVVVAGNPFDGLTIHGPFDTVEEASDWAERQLKNEEWWAVVLTTVPEGD